MGDDDISSTLSGEGAEVFKNGFFGEVALGVGEEGIFSMKIPVTILVPAHGSEDYARNFGEWGHPSDSYKKRDY